jgi:hypothetical protein
MAGAPRWRTAPAEALQWRELEDELVVRNAATGSTHLLEPMAGKALVALARAPAGMTLA